MEVLRADALPLLEKVGVETPKVLAKRRAAYVKRQEAQSNG